MNLWLLILLMLASIVGSFCAWLNLSEWKEEDYPGKHFIWWLIFIICLGIAIMSFLGLFATLSRDLNSSKEEYAALESQLQARCDSIEGKYGNGSCYKDGIQINWSTYGQEE